MAASIGAVRTFGATALAFAAITNPVLAQQTVVPPQSIGPTQNTVMLYLPDQETSDARIAEFVAYITAVVPAERWPNRAVLTPEKSIEWLIDEVFDYFVNNTAFSRPLTVAALRRSLIEANPALRQPRTESVVVRVPPIPVRAHGIFNDDSVRVYSPQTAQYDLSPNLGQFRLATNPTALGKEVSSLAFGPAASAPGPVGGLTAAVRGALDDLLTKLKATGEQFAIYVRPFAPVGATTTSSDQIRATAIRNYLMAREGKDELTIMPTAAATAFVPPEGSTATRGVQVLTISDDPSALPFAQPATESALRRRSTVTGIPLLESDIQAARAAGKVRSQPPGTMSVSAYSDANGTVSRTGYSTIEFLSTKTERNCKATQWLQTSPFFPGLQARLTESQRKALRARANTSRLRLVDADFTGAGHGRKVRSLVLGQLETLGLRSELEEFVNDVDFKLHSQKERDWALAVLRKYEQSPQFVSVPGLVEDARRWIVEESEKTLWSNGTIHDLVMQAILWDSLRYGGVVNMSFRLKGPALREMQPQLLTGDPRPFVVIAAGNDPIPLDPTWVPQDASVTFGNTVNVTYGFENGRVLGTTGGGAETRGLVSILAPGCGFQTSELTESEAGSSLAAPFVAVAAWLKSLLDGLTGAELRRVLIQSVSPWPADTGIESAGFFDAPRLLVREPRPPFKLPTSGPPQPVSQARLEYHQVGSPLEWTGLPSIPGRPMSVVVGKDDRGFFIWWRTTSEPTTFPAVGADPPVRIDRLRYYEAGTLLYSSIEAYLAQIRELVL